MNKTKMNLKMLTCVAKMIWDLFEFACLLYVCHYAMMYHVKFDYQEYTTFQTEYQIEKYQEIVVKQRGGK